MKNDDILGKYIKLLARVRKRQEDYLRIKTNVHNKAMDQIIELDAGLSEDVPAARRIYFELMKSEDEYVRWFAAARCLKLGILIEESLKILDDIIAHGDGWLVWHAERTLKIWRGEITPDQLD